MTAPSEQRQRYRPGSLEILAVGLVVLIVGQRWLVGLFDDPAVQTGATIFVSIVVQALPFLVLGVVLSGAIAAFVPASFWKKRRQLSRNMSCSGSKISLGIMTRPPSPSWRNGTTRCGPRVP